MNKVGTRIYFDNITKNVLLIAGEMEGTDLPPRRDEDIRYIDFAYGEMDLITKRIVGIDENNNPIIEDVAKEETPEQKRIRELEEMLGAVKK